MADLTMAFQRTQDIQSNQLRNSTSVLASSSSPPGPFGLSTVSSGPPPPIPPRQPNQSYSNYNDYRPFGSSYYGGYGYNNQYRSYGGYGSFGSYSPYSGIGGYNNYNPLGRPSGDDESRFLQYAEESTRSTFRVVETVLQTFSSLTMLLESTYFAMTNSFRAILSVAENIGKLKSTLGQILSTFALIRFMKWIYRKIMHFSGMKVENSTNDELWEKTFAKANGNDNSNGVPSSWSGVLMFSIFVIIPYVIHKISNNLKQIQTKGSDPREWYKSDEPVYTATVQYDFVATNSDELSVRAGQKVYLAPQSLQPSNLPGWCKVTDNTNMGLVPYNYITIVGMLKKKSKMTNNENLSTSTILPESIQLSKAEPSISMVERNVEQAKNGDCNTDAVSS